jgi:putative nucleotidyltransferase with HDIG domain
VTLAGAVVVVFGFTEANVNEVVALAALVLMAMAAERFDFDLYVDSRVSLAFVPIFAACLIAGSTGLALVATAAVIASAVGVRVPWYKTAFNFGALLLAGAASVSVLKAFGSTSDVGAWPEVLIPVLLAAGANFLVNAGLITAIICLTNHASPRSVWREHFTWLWPHYLALGLLGLAIASAYQALGLWGIAVFIVPPLMMRVSLKQYLDKTTKGVLDLRQAHGELQGAHGQLTTAMSNLDDAYDGTLRALVAALDARDSETGGHSSRVADLTAAIAEEMGISRESEEGRIIAWGALLHDVGKIAVPDAILRKPGKLTEEEWVTMRTHARAGYEIVESVDFLAPAAKIILAHHERWDGAGYPRGLAGQDVPLGARIFMIADTFDAITSVRPYKAAIPAEEALAEILRNSGTQFDPAAVKAFLIVYQQRFVGSDGSRASVRQLSGSIKKVLAEAAARLETNS